MIPKKLLVSDLTDSEMDKRLSRISDIGRN